MVFLWKWPTTPSTSKLPDPSVNGPDLVVVGALPAQHPVLPVLIDREQGNVDEVVTRHREAPFKISLQITFRHTNQWILELLLEPVQVTIHIVRLPSGVSEDGNVGFGIA